MRGSTAVAALFVVLTAPAWAGRSPLLSAPPLPGDAPRVQLPAAASHRLATPMVRVPWREPAPPGAIPLIRPRGTLVSSGLVAFGLAQLGATVFAAVSTFTQTRQPAVPGSAFWYAVLSAELAFIPVAGPAALGGAWLGTREWATGAALLSLAAVQVAGLALAAAGAWLWPERWLLIPAN